jgi:stringent starvation protein A
MGIGTKRTVMSIHAISNCMYSHLVRLVLAVKGVHVEHYITKNEELAEDLRAINPTGTLPMFVDRDLVICNPRITVEYIEDRYPHPPLMSVYPIARAETRKMMDRIDTEWYSLGKCIQQGENAEKARSYLLDSLVGLEPVFADKPYFLSDEFSVLDCVLAPLLWRLPNLGVFIPSKAVGLQAYMQKLFQLEAFQISLCEAEK